MSEDQLLKILFIEDTPEDLELAKREIRKKCIKFESCLARTEDEFLKGLYEFKPDIIISDYLLPKFDGMRALELSLTYDNTTPFIILTGNMTEEIAVEAIKAGATDYVLKEHISRLPFAVKVAIKKKDVLLEKKQAIESLEFMSKIVEQSPYSVISTDMEGFITSWNRGAERIFGLTADEAIGQHISLVYTDTDPDIPDRDVLGFLFSEEYHHTRARLKRKNGESFIGSLSHRTIKDGAGRATGMVKYILDVTQNLETEKELQMKDQAIEANIDGIVFLELDGNVSYANKAALGMWGYENGEEVIGKKTEEFWYSEFERNRVLKKVKENGIKEEHLALKKDGTVFPVRLSAIAIKDDEGKPMAYMASVADMTEMKKAEEAVKKSEEKYCLLAENTLDGIWLMDMNLVFTYVNHAVYSILGYLPEEWMGSKLSDHCDEENLKKMLTYVQIGLENPSDTSGITFQVEMLNKKGEQVPLEITGKILYGDDGIPIGIHGTTRDITERVQAEEALKESEERLKRAMLVSEHGFWEWDLDRNEFYFSPCLYTMFGYEDRELPMSFDTWEKLMHPSDWKNIMPKIIRSATEGEPFNFEIRMLSKSGEWRWVLAKGNTFNESRRNNRTIGTLVDITERKKTEQHMLLAKIAAEEANRCKTELIANMNHELKTPLNSVIGYSDVLMELNIPAPDAEQKRYLEMINNAGYKLLNLVNNVLDLAQIESDDLSLRFSLFNPLECVNEVIETTRMMALKKKIYINVNIAENVTEITADADKFKEIIYNLMENALKFTPSGGLVNIDVKIENNHIEVSVGDTGIGIAEKDKERIFDPFVQVDGSYTRRYGGAGLGLVLVKEYLKMQNGNIRVESEPGKGSKFTFQVPVYPKKGGSDIY